MWTFSLHFGSGSMRLGRIRPNYPPLFLKGSVHQKLTFGSVERVTNVTAKPTGTVTGNLAAEKNIPCP